MSYFLIFSPPLLWTNRPYFHSILFILFCIHAGISNFLDCGLGERERGEREAEGEWRGEVCSRGGDGIDIGLFNRTVTNIVVVVNQCSISYLMVPIGVLTHFCIARFFLYYNARSTPAASWDLSNHLTVQLII